jgi:hypothetical protein
MSLPQNLLPQPPETLLPENAEAEAALAAARAGEAQLASVAATYPTYSGAWAALADEAYAAGNVIASYAYARTGYHRGLDALRRAGWRGAGPVPASHLPNQGFLLAVLALADAAAAIGETDEHARCMKLLTDSDPRAVEVLGAR